ncbi:MAG: hypothetical protein FWG98_07215 [Candidatus Cloacimonetes bacterium]|nr:hypothetical protein [Candidatus Cloacimonadota bacterium]
MNFFPLLYAETHYHLKYLFPRYFKKEAEVLFDLPRCVLIQRTQSKIPIFLLIKDADRYPVIVSDIKARVFFGRHEAGVQKREIKNILLKPQKTNLTKSDVESIKINSNKSLDFIEFYIEIEELWINQNIIINIDFKINNKKYINDNYHGLSSRSFKVFISEKEKLFPDNWYLGDTHYHSSYTSDQVEYGAPLEMTKKMAYSMGLDWFFVTDHSYDLDDIENDYTKNDKELKKWTKLKSECANLSDKEMKIKYGEEVSIGNINNQNVHLIVINNPNFIEGKGDSAEKWFKNRPDMNLRDLSITNDNKILCIAAHPFERVPILQKLLLNRGNWSEEDFSLPIKSIKYLQIINGQSLFENMELIEKYFKLLLSGKDYYILAGNDAHGNFQYMKQIEIPFIKLFSRQQQIFGQYFTAYQHSTNDPIEGLKTKKIVVSNGPYLSFSLIFRGKEYFIGEIIGENLNIESQNVKESIEKVQHSNYSREDNTRQAVVKYEYSMPLNLSEERKSFLQKETIIKMIVGDVKTQQITKTRLDMKKKEIIINLQQNSFIILMLYTRNGYLALTNPIFTALY